MPVSESCSPSTQSGGLKTFNSSDSSNEFNRNFNQSLLGLRALNSQTGQELNFSEYLSLRMEKKDDEVVILDDPKMLPKNCNEIKSNKFTINDSIRNSFKDIMSNVKNGKLVKPQEDINSFSNLLTQTKSIGLETKDKTPVLKNGTSTNVLTEKSLGNNLFENLKDIQSTTEAKDSKLKLETKEVTNGVDTPENPEVIELDDSLEEELLKSDIDPSKTEEKTSSEDIGKKEEDKLLQLDTDTQESLDDKSVSDDLKVENKLLELDNENSNHSVTSVKSNSSDKSIHSVKSDHSVKSIHSVKSDHSVKSNHSVKSDHSIKSVHSIHSVDSDHLVKNTSCSESGSPITSSDHPTEAFVTNHNESSNHSVKSDISNHSTKSEHSIISANSEHSAKKELDNEHSNLSIKSNTSIKSDSSRTKSSNKSVTEDSSGLNTENNKKHEGETPQSVCPSANYSEVSQDACPLLESSTEAKDEQMEVDSEVIKDENSSDKISLESKNSTDNEECSIKSPNCDTDCKSVQSEVTGVCDEENDSKSCESDRKRPADDDDEDSLSSEPKRSRLDEMIGKLGCQIGIPLDKVKTIDELSDTDASHMDSEVTDPKSEDTSSATETEDEEEEIKTPVQSPRKNRRVSQRELGTLVKAQVMLYLRTYRDETIKDLHRKINDLQGNNEMWKNRAKDLERRMLELTVLQQKHEKRKAKTAALRQISSKSIGIQVDVNKVEKPEKTSPTMAKEIVTQQQVQNQTTPNKSGSKTPPRSVVSQTPTKTTVSQTPTKTTVSQTPPKTVVSQTPPRAVVSQSAPPRTTMAVMVQPTVTLPTTTKFIPISTNLTQARPTSSVSTQSQIQQALSIPIPVQPTQILLSPTSIKQQEYPNSKTVKSLLDSSRQQNQQQKVVQNNTMLFPTTAIPNVGQLASPQFIMVTSTPSTGTSVKTVIPTNIVSCVSKPTAKIIDLTDEEENASRRPLNQMTKTLPAVVTSMTPQGLRHMTSQHTTIPPQSILLGSPAATRFVNPQQQPVQLVFSGAPNIRPGNLVQVVTTPTTQVRQPGVPPPHLRPAQLVPLSPLTRANIPPTSLVTGAQIPQNVRVVRPPPPLQSAPSNQTNTTRPQLPPAMSKPAPAQRQVHPAPLPVYDPPAIKPGEKPLAPKPTLKISRVTQGIVLSWNMTYIAKNHANIQSYQLYAYQETAAPPVSTLWKKVGDVKALPLPMACTLTQFQEGNRYHFAVRPMDTYGRPGPFSDPSSIHLMPMK